ncbi:hypothetical protein EPUL_006116, partial [Erysiphe pulchra]
MALFEQWRIPTAMSICRYRRRQRVRHTAQNRRYNSETLHSPVDINPSNKINGSISKFTEGTFDDARVDISEREQIAEEYARAFYEATSCVQKLGLGRDTSPLERALAS